MKNKPNLFTIVFIAAVFSISACSQLHELQQSLSGGNSNDNKCNTSTTEASVSYANPFADATSHKIILYDAEKEAYTIRELPADFSSLYSAIKRLPDASIMFRGQITDQKENIFRFYADGTLSTIDPIALFAFDADIVLTDFGAELFNHISENIMAIPYTVNYADGSSELVLIEYNINTTNLRNVAVLKRTEPAVECTDLFTEEETAQLATAQMLDDMAAANYAECNATDTCTNGECQAAADAHSALCTLRDTLYEKYQCPKMILCNSMQCAISILK